MYSKLKIFALFCVLITVLFSCGEEEYTGDELINYPDFEKILQDEWDMKEPLVYWKVTRSPSSVDSTQIPTAQMPWQEINDLFKKASIQKKELDHHYSIEIMNDSLANTITLYYKSLAPKDYTKSIDIVSDGESGEISNLYFEASDESAPNGDAKKVLFIPNKLLQIQSSKAGNIGVDTYFFPE